MNKEYEVFGPVQKLEQRSPPRSITELEHLTDFDSIDVEFSPEGKPHKLTRYAFAGDVKEIEHYLYNDSGKLKLILYFNETGSKIASTGLHYDAEGMRVGWTRRGASGELEQHCTERHVKGLLASSAISDAQGTPILERDFEYKDNVLWRSVARYFDHNGKLEEQSVSYYDSTEKVIETYGLTADGKPLENGRYKFEFDEQGRKLKVWSFNDWAEDDVNALSIYDYTADEFGNWIECRTFYRSRTSEWKVRVTTRKLTYYRKQ